jgi:hypothetical protein
MYLLEEFLAILVLATLLGFAGTVILIFTLMLHDEADFFDRALSTGSVALPPSWPEIWAVMKITERWQRFSVSSSQKARGIFWRLNIVSWARNSCKAASDCIAKEIRAAKNWTGRMMPASRNARGGTKNGTLLF